MESELLKMKSEGEVMILSDAAERLKIGESKLFKYDFNGHYENIEKMVYNYRRPYLMLSRLSEEDYTVDLFWESWQYGKYVSSLTNSYKYDNVSSKMYVVWESSIIARKIAAFLNAVAVLEQEESNIIIYQKEIEERFPDLEKDWYKDTILLEEILHELDQYPGLEESEVIVSLDSVDGLNFDLCLFTDYIAY